MAVSTSKDMFIVCRNSQGTEFRATLLRLMQYTVVFEVYNPYSIIQLGEVLTNFKMVLNDRVVYSGKAVVSNLVNTGILLVCECTLEESWLDVNAFASIHKEERLQEEFQGFLRDWEKFHQIDDKLKVAVADLQTFLLDVRRWLEQVELGIRSDPARERSRMEMDVILKLRGSMSPAIDKLFQRFEKTAASIPEEFRAIHWSYSKQQLHPLMLCSPFVYRVYHKPLGYAGDYEMINMMLRDPYEGASLFAKILNIHFLDTSPCRAHRNRIKTLTRNLRREAGRVLREKGEFRIINMGCGPAKEIQDFIVEEELSDRSSFVLMDFNDETLEYAEKTLEDVKRKHHRRARIQMVKKSVHQILKESFKAPGPQEMNYDFIYCAGLFDYLEDRICKRLMEYFYGLLSPGGLLLATNVTPNSPIRNILESLLEWPMVYRNAEQMSALIPDLAGKGSFKVYTEETGVNIFAEVRKAG